MKPNPKTDGRKTSAEGLPFPLSRLSLAVGFLRLLRAPGLQSLGAKESFGDGRNPLVAQALTVFSGRVSGHFQQRLSGPLFPVCEHIEIRALFYNGSRLFEYRADLTSDHEEWRFLPFEVDSPTYHPLMVAEEDGRRWRRESPPVWSRRAGSWVSCWVRRRRGASRVSPSRTEPPWPYGREEDLGRTTPGAR